MIKQRMTGVFSVLSIFGLLPERGSEFPKRVLKKKNRDAKHPTANGFSWRDS